MTKYVIESDGGLEVTDLDKMPADATVVAEVVTTADDPLCLLANPVASPSDFWWPENMFGGKPVRFSELIE